MSLLNIETGQASSDESNNSTVSSLTSQESNPKINKRNKDVSKFFDTSIYILTFTSIILLSSMIFASIDINIIIKT